MAALQVEHGGTGGQGQQQVGGQAGQSHQEHQQGAMSCQGKPALAALG